MIDYRLYIFFMLRVYCPLMATKILILPHSLVRGNWGQWRNATCTKTCGSGTRTRTRLCDSPAPSNGGSQCVDGSGAKVLTETLQNQTCNTQACPGL